MSPSLKYYVKRALTLPPHIVLKKLFIMGKNHWENRQKEHLDRINPTYSYYPAKLHHFVNLPQHAPLVNNHLLDHHFNLLGSGWVEVKHGMQAKGLEGHVFPSQTALQIDSKGEWLKEKINPANLNYAQKIWQLVDPEYVPIDWHIDFKSGYRWSENMRSYRIPYGHLPGVDVKVPWELSRMQHLPQLAWAYSKEKKEKYVREFQNQILDFIATNPPRFGVNWCCTMDVGIRIANWLITYDLFQSYGALFDKAFEEAFTSSIYDHGKHITDHLEWMPTFRSNHYLANIVGLLFVGAYLPGTAETEKWISFSIQELIKEVPLQFYEEGSSFEGSTSYHCLSAQIVAYSTALAIKKKGEGCFPNWYFKRLEKMAIFVKHITKPSGDIVQIGDHDSGYLFRLFPSYDTPLNRTHLIHEIEALFDISSSSHFSPLFSHNFPSIKDPTTHKKVFHKPLNAWKEKLVTLPNTHIAFPCPLEKITFHPYPEFGLYIYRSPHLFLSIRVGSLGHLGRGGHAHNDQLSIELVIEGKEVVVDPGTYLYTPLPQRRNDYRSVCAHFAPQIQGKEPSDIGQGVFILSGDPKGEYLYFDTHTFLGMHQGYGFPVYRLVELKENTIHITDFSEGDLLVPIEKVLKRVQTIPFSPGYGRLK